MPMNQRERVSMALQLTEPGKPLVRRMRPTSGTKMSSRTDWHLVRRDYIEGVRNDPDGDPLDMHWPTLAELAKKYGIKEPTIGARSARERWSAQKRSFVSQIEIKQRAARMREMKKEGIAFDKNVLAIGKLGVNIVVRRLAEITKAAGQREALSEAFIRQMERGETPDVSVMGDMADFDAKELSMLADAAQRFTELGRSVIGVPDETLLIRDEAESGGSIIETMEQGDDERLADLVDALQNAGVFDVMMGNMVRPAITAGDDDVMTVDAEVIGEVIGEEIDPQVVDAVRHRQQTSRFLAGADPAVVEAHTGGQSATTWV